MMNKTNLYSRCQTFWLVALRVVIGWHFLYEGLYKLLKTNWTAKHYLNDSEGVFQSVFESMASNPTILNIIDTLNVWGLILIGLSLILGCFSKYASMGGVVMLALFYLSHIPFIGAAYMMPTEGNYLWLDKNIVEICALMVVLVFPTSHLVGLDSLIFNGKKEEAL